MLFRCIFFENGSNNGKVIENEIKKYLIFAINKGEWVGFSLEAAYYDFRQDGVGLPVFMYHDETSGERR